MFIITAEPKEEFDCNGKSLGIGNKRVICYSPRIGRRRIYRQHYPFIDKGLKVLGYKLEKNAQEVCDYANKVSKGNFKVEEID